MKNEIFFIRDSEKVLDTVKIANKAKKAIVDNNNILKTADIPSDFESLKRIKECSKIMENTVNKIENANKMLLNKIEEIMRVRNYKYKQISAKYLYNSIYKGKGAYGLSYEELDKMEYKDLNAFLGSEVLKTPILKKLETPLDENNSEIQKDKRTKNMYNYAYRIVNAFNNDTSVCEGAAFLNKNMVAYCDIDTENKEGLLRLMCRQKKLDVIKGKYDRTATEKSSIKIEGHSNDITYIPEDKILLHIDDKNNVIDVLKIDENYNIDKTKTIDNIKANGIAYDKKSENIVIISGTDAEYYSKNSFLNDKVKSKTNFKIPDRIKSANSSTYYNYIQGVTAYDGVLYVSYTGYSTDKDEYDWDEGDKPVGNMIVAYDYKNGGEAFGRIIDNVETEIEGIDFNEKLNLVSFYNGGHWTRVHETNLVNAKVIAEYKKSLKKKK